MRAAVGATQKHYRPNITHRFVCVIHTAKLVAEDTIWWRQNEYQCSKYKIPHHVSIQAVGCLISSILFDIVVPLVSGGSGSVFLFAAFCVAKGGLT